MHSSFLEKTIFLFLALPFTHPHQQRMQGTNADHLLTGIALQPPSLLLDASSTMYTDGNKKCHFITTA